MGMEWPEVKRRLTKECTSVQVLADLEGVPYKTMYNRIMQHQIKDGITYLTPKNSKGLKRSEEMKNIKRKKIREAEKAQGLPEVVNEPDNIPEVVNEPDNIPEDVYTCSWDLMPETIEELNHMYFTCKQLAERYQKQANDWLQIMEMCAARSNKSREEISHDK